MRKEITFDRFIRGALVAAAILAVFWFVKELSSVLLPFFIAWFLAYLLYPIVKFVQYKLHVPTRALSIIVTLIFVTAIIGGVNIGEMVRDWIAQNKESIASFFRSKDFTETVKTTMPKVFNMLGQTASIVISIVASCITLLYMFFILLDYEFLTENWIRIFPKKVRPFWHELATDVERELNNYIHGQGLVALCMGIMFCIGFTIIGFPMAIGLGILIGILDLVPYLHSFALIPTVFLAILKAADTGENFWAIFLSALAVFIIVQIITDMVVTPKVMGKAMGLNPAILLLSLSVWGALLGFLGLIIALPLTTLIIAYWQRYVTKEHEDQISLPLASSSDEPKTKKGEETVEHQ